MFKQLGTTNFSLAAVANQAAVNFNTTPFLPGRRYQGVLHSQAAAGAPEVKIQTAPAGSNVWTDAATINAANGAVPFEFVADAQVRAIVSTAGTAGTATALVDGVL